MCLQSREQPVHEGEWQAAAVHTCFHAERRRVGQGEHVLQLEDKVGVLQQTAEALAAREETSRTATGGMADRLHRAEAALQEAQMQLDEVRCVGCRTD